MPKERDNTGSSWLSLQDAAKRLSAYLSGPYPRFALSDVLGRGRVPILAKRSDVPAMLPEQVADLLVKANSVSVIPNDNTIRAHFRISGERQADDLFGPRSRWRFADADLRGLPLEFRQVRLCWLTLMSELRSINSHPADEEALCRLGLWEESWSVTPPENAEGADITLAAAAAAHFRRPSKRDALKVWIEQRHPKGLPSTATDKVVARDYLAATGVPVDPRTVRRARGGK